jgi:glycogen synthase
MLPSVGGDRAAWQTLIDNGMAKDFSWDVQGKLYEELYRRLSQNG